MTTQRTEHNFSSNDIIHLIVNHGLFTEELDVFRENTMEQILVELADNLRLDSLSSQIKFINVRTSDMSRDRTITVEELGLIDGDTLMIDDASPDATIVSYFWLVNNTLYVYFTETAIDEYIAKCTHRAKPSAPTRSTYRKRRGE